MRLGFQVLLALLLFSGSLSATESGTAAEQAFNQLSALVGTWQGRFENGRQHSVSYRLSAGGTVLVETWTLAPGRESMTLYHLDGDELLADHYCPQGNVPRLRLVKGDAAGKLSFEFRDGTNLQDKDKAHQHSFWIALRGPDSYQRSETYVENGTPTDEADKAEAGAAITYTRVGLAQPVQ